MPTNGADPRPDDADGPKEPASDVLKAMCQKFGTHPRPRSMQNCKNCGLGPHKVQLCYVKYYAGCYMLMCLQCYTRVYPKQRGPTEENLAKIEAQRELDRNHAHATKEEAARQRAEENARQKRERAQARAEKSALEKARKKREKDEAHERDRQERALQEPKKRGRPPKATTKGSRALPLGQGTNVVRAEPILANPPAVPLADSGNRAKQAVANGSQLDAVLRNDKVIYISSGSEGEEAERQSGASVRRHTYGLKTGGQGLEDYRILHGDGSDSDTNPGTTPDMTTPALVIKLLLWAKDGRDAFEFDVELNNPEICDVLGYEDVAATVFVCPGFGRALGRIKRHRLASELGELHADQAIDVARSSIIGRDIDENHVWVVYWAEKDSPAMVWKHPVVDRYATQPQCVLGFSGGDRTIIYGDHGVTAWHDSLCDWMRVERDEPIDVNPFSRTILVRGGAAELLPNVGVKIELLNTRRLPPPLKEPKHVHGHERRNSPSSSQQGRAKKVRREE
ncbi:hypothetical protein C8Q79DRAFT_930549 [Trametes meyenii]|nr:hypothetical protein C8Q79DRAFT_930549 [Trametes meyenii]